MILSNRVLHLDLVDAAHFFFCRLARRWITTRSDEADGKSMDESSDFPRRLRGGKAMITAESRMSIFQHVES